MNVLLETTFDRLLSKYEQTFGEPPPFTAATADEVIAYMRRRLRKAADDTAGHVDAQAGWIAAAEHGAATGPAAACH